MGSFLENQVASDQLFSTYTLSNTYCQQQEQLCPAKSNMDTNHNMICVKEMFHLVLPDYK